MKVCIILSFLCAIALAAAEVQYQHPEEWQLWKSQHGKSYQSELEELERHLVWLSNKKYIESHNNNAEVFGYTLAMNGFGDLVSLYQQHCHMWCATTATYLAVHNNKDSVLSPVKTHAEFNELYLNYKSNHQNYTAKVFEGYRTYSVQYN